MEYYAAERKKELLPFATAWMELESIMLSEISQMVRGKYHMISPLTGIFFKILKIELPHDPAIPQAAIYTKAVRAGT